MAFLGFGVSRVLKAVAASGVVMGVLAMAALPPGAFAGSGEPAHKLLKKSSKQASAPVKQNWSSGGNTAGGKATTETAVLSGQATTPFITADSTDKMQAVLSRYEQIVSAGGWPSVPSAKFKKGAKNKGVFALNQRLFVEGYLRKEGTEGEFADTYTSATADAVSRFQRNHGLAVTGIVDKPTLRELNVSASSRLATLRANVPRLAEYSKDLGGRYVVVNVPAMQIETVSNGSVYSRHNAVVGRPSRPTPVVMTPLTVIRFNPYWNAPPSIVEKDILPSMMSGSPAKVMEKMNMKIFKGVGGPEINPNSVNWRRAVVDDYHFRQEPGGTNAMATAKIEFTSPHGIYLHDTPEPQLFSHGQRFYSSGCVRVEKVAVLIDWILQGQEGIDSSRISDLAETKERLDVTIANAPQIRVAYLTAWPTADGVAAFRPDIYELDGTGFVIGQPLPVGETMGGKRYVLKPIPRSPSAVDEDEASGFASFFFRNGKQNRNDVGVRSSVKSDDSLIGTSKKSATAKKKVDTKKTTAAITSKKKKVLAAEDVAGPKKTNWNSGDSKKTAATKKKKKVTSAKAQTKQTDKKTVAAAAKKDTTKKPTSTAAVKKDTTKSSTTTAAAKSKPSDKCKAAADGTLPKGCEVAAKKPAAKPAAETAAAN